MGSGGVGQGDSGQKSRWSEMRVGLRKRLAELGALGSKQFSARCDFRVGTDLRRVRSPCLPTCEEGAQWELACHDECLAVPESHLHGALGPFPVARARCGD